MGLGEVLLNTLLVQRNFISASMPSLVRRYGVGLHTRWA